MHQFGQHGLEILGRLDPEGASQAGGADPGSLATETCVWVEQVANGVANSHCSGADAGDDLSFQVFRLCGTGLHQVSDAASGMCFSCSSALAACHQSVCWSLRGSVVLKVDTHGCTHDNLFS